MKQDKKVPLPPGVGLRRPLHQPLQAPHRGFLLRGLRPPAHDGARLRDARVHHAVRPSGAADRGGCRLQPAVLFGRLLHGEPRRALPQDRHGQGEVVEEVEGRGRKGRGREEEEERHTTLQKTKKTRDFLERDLSSLHSLSLFSTPNAPRKTHSLAPCDLSLSTHCVRKKKAKGEENAPLSLAFTLRIKVAFIVEPFGVRVFREQLRFLGFEVRPRFIFVPV